MEPLLKCRSELYMFKQPIYTNLLLYYTIVKYYLHLYLYLHLHLLHICIFLLNLILNY